MPRELNTTVTYLELRFPRRPRTVSRVSGQAALLKSEKPPVHFYRYLFDVVGRDYYWVSRKALDDQALREIIHNRSVEIFVPMFNGAPAGLAELKVLDSKEFEISFFGLIPELVGKGLGAFFLDQVLQILASRDAQRATLETCTLDHPRALPLYQRFGFEPYGQTQRVLVVDE